MRFGRLLFSENYKSTESLAWKENLPLEKSRGRHNTQIGVLNQGECFGKSTLFVWAIWRKILFTGRILAISGMIIFQEYDPWKISCHIWPSKIKYYSQNTHLGLKTPILVLRWPGDFSKGEFSFRAKESVLLKCHGSVLLTKIAQTEETRKKSVNNLENPWKSGWNHLKWLNIWFDLLFHISF